MMIERMAAALTPGAHWLYFSARFSLWPQQGTKVAPRSLFTKGSPRAPTPANWNTLRHKSRCLPLDATSNRAVRTLRNICAGVTVQRGEERKGTDSDTGVAKEFNSARGTAVTSGMVHSMLQHEDGVAVVVAGVDGRGRSNGVVDGSTSDEPCCLLSILVALKTSSRTWGRSRAFLLRSSSLRIPHCGGCPKDRMRKNRVTPSPRLS
jgi:hypothetical protein